MSERRSEGTWETTLIRSSARSRRCEKKRESRMPSYLDREGGREGGREGITTSNVPVGEPLHRSGRPPPKAVLFALPNG